MINQQEYNELISEGYIPQQIQQADNYLEMQGRGYNINTTPLAPFTMNQQANIVEWQLDLDKEKERIFHLLRGDETRENEEGKIVWVENKHRRILNEQGVAEVMRIVDFFLSKNKILSDFDEDLIFERVHDFGQKLKDLLFLKYEKIGLERKNYDMLVWELVTSVEDTYRRAINGAEKRSLREARQITQSEQLGGQNEIPMATGRPRGILNPARYFVGKYKY